LTLTDDLERLAEFSSAGPGTTRLAWSPEHLSALNWLGSRAEAAGMIAELDSAGNLIARWGADRPGGALVLGSHLDSVPAGGRYDGALGVLGALAAVELLRERGFEPSRPVWLVAFMDEEGTRFGESMFGSRAFVGENLSSYLEQRDSDGVRVAEAMRATGLDPATVGSAATVDEAAAFIELHVEQGRVLTDAGVDVGVVTAIVGLVQASVEICGQSDHGGATPMTGRRDALVAAARIITALRDWARSESETTATIGTISVAPGAYNVIPGRCTFSVDLRAADESDFEAAPAQLSRLIGRLAEEESVEATVVFTDQIPPAPMDDELIELIERAAEGEGASHMRLPSGAGHDAQVLARRVPAAMVFVPSQEGISHSPDEFTTPEHCELGARILARLIEFADQDGGGAGAAMADSAPGREVE
jgi:hydantoinase/carbamoylase family amidase